MQITAKPVVNNKLWILESKGKKVATLQADPDGLTLYLDNKKEKFASIKTLTNKYNIVFSADLKNTEVCKKDTEVYGFPCDTEPFNIVFDVQRKVPLFTKNKKSRSRYCAGYYIIQYEHGWIKSFCPKNITLLRYKFKGPFTTKAEMLEHLRIANNG